MDTTILKKILNHDFYEANKDRLTDKLFEKEARDAYETIAASHEQYGKDLTIAEVTSIYQADNPMNTVSQNQEFVDFMANVGTEHTISDDIASDIIAKLHRRKLMDLIADKALQVSEDVADAYEELLALVEDSRSGFEQTEEIEFENTDVFDLLALSDDAERFSFNLKPLRDKVYGIGRQEFGAVFANTNVGKSAFMLSVCFGPEGFVDQGLKVFYVCNEEAAKRTRQRAIIAYSGISKEKMVNEPDCALDAAEKWNKVNHLAYFKDCQDLTLPEIEKICDQVGFDVIVFDQMDKVNISGKFNASHEKFGELYRQAREVAKRQNAAVFAVTQASADARDSTVVSHFDMAGSKVSKSAELDLAIGIGAKEIKDAQAEPDFTRWLNISKNKLNGWHGTVPCMLDQKVNRYVV